eukprot:XP_028333805.1 dynein regulatory complex subunit 4 isoform X2 [Physeter catodon]
MVEEHIGRIREELDRERKERNYFQLERDKIHSFWEITRRQLEEKKAELRNKDREMEEAEERHQVEIKVYKQKVKHLLYEHQNSLMEMKAEGTVAMKLAQKERRAQEGTLCRDMRALQVGLKEQELASEVVVKNLKLKHAEEITKIRKDCERQVREIEAKYYKKVRMLRDELELRRKTEIHEVEERKNGQISMLMQRHEDAFTDIRNYYNEITFNNLALISSLKEQVQDMRRKEEHLQKEMTEVSAQSRRLADPLQKARDEMTEMQQQLRGYQRDKQTLLCTKARLKVAEKELKSLRWEREVLEQRFLRVSSRDAWAPRPPRSAQLSVDGRVSEGSSWWAAGGARCCPLGLSSEAWTWPGPLKEGLLSPACVCLQVPSLYVCVVRKPVGANTRALGPCAGPHEWSGLPDSPPRLLRVPA